MEICFWTTNCCTWVCISTIETKVPEPDADTPGAYKTTSAEQGVTVTWGNQITAGF